MPSTIRVDGVVKRPPPVPLTGSGDVSPEPTGNTNSSTVLPPISPQHELDIKSLALVADNRQVKKFWKPRVASNLGAEITTSLAMSASLAGRQLGLGTIETESTRLFTERFHVHKQKDMKTLSHDQLHEIAGEFFWRIDDIFFFGLLTREIKGKRGRRSLVRFITDDSAATENQGIFRPKEDHIKVWLRDTSGERRRLEQLIATIAHECVHAYLCIFTDYRDPNYEEHVLEHYYHGTMFWELVEFILLIIFLLTRSPLFQWEIKKHRGLSELCASYKREFGPR
ncbi:hypothetical protein F4777DRAFT_250365 [Nemania sp. FL0916]|nr:hypothetical protein F4777DRAFT_250365 [Nemania sp. FL0916]